MRCPSCGSEKIEYTGETRAGWKDFIDWYQCKKCKKEFSVLAED